MGAIVLDASKVNSYVLPNLLKSNNVMKTAYNTGQALKKSLPSSFAYKSTLNNIVEEIYNLRKEIKNIDSMIDKKIQRAKTIETKRDSKITRLAQSASKIGSVTGALVGGAIGASTGSIIRTAAGVSVGAAVGSFVGKALVNTGAKIASNVKSLCINLWDGAKELGKKIYDGCKKVVKKATSFVKDKALPFLKNVGNHMLEIGKKIVTGIGRTLASVANFFVSIVEGLVSFVESLVDVVFLAVGVVLTPFTFITDLVNSAINQEWTFTNTGTLWKKGVMPLVATDYTDKIFTSFYETKGMKFIERNAFSPFQRGSENNFMYEVGKGVGYVTGTVILTLLTAGTGSAAIGAAKGAGAAGTSVLKTAATAGVNVLKSQVKNTVKTIITKGGYKVLLKSISGSLKTKAAVKISSTLSGVAKFGSSTQKSYNKLSETEKQSGAKIAKVLGSSGLKGVFESFVWYATYGGGKDFLAQHSNKVISKAGQLLGGKIDPLNPNAFEKVIGANLFKGKIMSKVLPSFNISSTTKATLQGLKGYLSSATDTIITGEFDRKKAQKEGLIAAGTSFAYDNLLGARLDAYSKQAKNVINDRYENSVPKLSDQALPDKPPVDAAKFIKDHADGLNVLFDATQSAGGKKIISKLVKEIMGDSAEMLLAS